MSPIQQMLLGVGAVATKTYVDDLFSTYLYTGNGSSKTITNGIDFTGKGGLVWTKARTNTDYDQHAWQDTARGAGYEIQSDNDSAQNNPGSLGVSFSSNGYSLGGGYRYNWNGADFVSWSFRKAPGFFDVVTYTGNDVSTGRQIAHNLKSVPGTIFIKSVSSAREWVVYHRGTDASSPENYMLSLNTTDARYAHSTYFYNTAPTATHFTIGGASSVNYNNENFVAYVFAGGDSTAATAHSVKFDGSDDYLSLAASTDLNLDGAFTIEAWVNVDDGGWSGTRRTLLANSTGWATNHAAVSLMNSAQSTEENTIILYNNTSTIADSSPVRIEPSDGWTHIAITRDSSNNIRIFKNGIQAGSTVTNSEEFKFGHGETWIGAITMSTGSTPETYDGKISNLRVVKGTAVYTSAFKPPTEPLTNITNTKLLCCDDTSATGATVKPGTITANSSPTGNHPSPFDDPSAFTFGENGDQGVIKCGSYLGNNSTTGPKIFLGWEPQWVLIKRSNASEDWLMFDCMRGIVTGGNEPDLRPNDSRAEGTSDWLEVDATGFQIKRANSNHINGDGDTYIFTAIRRSDGYVGKPVETGTDVFAMDTGNSSSTIPVWDSGFPVDYALYRQPATTDHWWTSARLIAGYELRANLTVAEGTYNDGTFDSNVGWNKGGLNTNYMSWMFKRHAGFDCVVYRGDGVAGKQIPHSLSKVPEMIWVKNRNDGNRSWFVYHKDSDSSAPEDKYLLLNSTTGVQDDTYWNDTAPTATHFTIGGGSDVNDSTSGRSHLALLFASVDGICKVGSYDGTGSAQTITTGFQPRFAIIRRIDGSEDHWVVLDTTRGWGSGDDKVLKLNSSDAQGTSEDMGSAASTGITLTSNGWVNHNTGKFIYYAHA